MFGDPDDYYQEHDGVHCRLAPQQAKEILQTANTMIMVTATADTAFE